MSEVKNSNLKQVTINLPQSTFEALIRFAKKEGIDVSKAYIILLNRALRLLNC